jgi:hypothetical protein
VAGVLLVEQSVPAGDLRDVLGVVQDRGEAPVPRDEVLLPVYLAECLHVVGNLVPVGELARVDLAHEALIHVELLPTGVEVEDVSLASGLHLGQDFGIVRTELEVDLGVGIGLGELDPEVGVLVARPLQDEELVRLRRHGRLARGRR